MLKIVIDNFHTTSIISVTHVAEPPVVQLFFHGPWCKGSCMDPVRSVALCYYIICGSLEVVVSDPWFLCCWSAPFSLAELWLYTNSPIIIIVIIILILLLLSHSKQMRGWPWWVPLLAKGNPIKYQEMRYLFRFPRSPTIFLYVVPSRQRPLEYG